MEATAKKASFLKEAVRRLGLAGMNVIPVFLGKEPVALPPEVSWDFFVSRGVKLEAVLRAVKPFWGPAQRLLLMKGPDWREEIEKLGPLLKKHQVGVERTILFSKPIVRKAVGAGDFMEDRTAGVIHDVICSLSEDFDSNRSFPDPLFSCGVVTRRWQALDSTYKSSTETIPKINDYRLKSA